MSGYLYLAGFEPRHGWMTAAQGLVDVSAYTGRQKPDWQWCVVDRVVEGDGSPYPIRVRVPGKGIAQFRRREVRIWRVPRDATEMVSDVLSERGDGHGRYPA